MEAELVKMSPKGQLVVPQNIRMNEAFRPGDRFVPLQIKNGIVFKKIEIPTIEFEKVSKEITEQFKNRKVKERDVSEAIRWVRKK